jgi:hypothetical protein
MTRLSTFLLCMLFLWHHVHGIAVGSGSFFLVTTFKEQKKFPATENEEAYAGFCQACRCHKGGEIP